uniref:Lymphocyte antigen 6 complex locus G6F n=1 Tax=Macaca mulatta TaxID=9544 RepID=A0A1L6Z9Z2_MACMU|nr:lymphocyte antigen 6 complex locus G6F [Macaca mulatta]
MAVLFLLLFLYGTPQESLLLEEPTRLWRGGLSLGHRDRPPHCFLPIPLVWLLLQPPWMLLLPSVPLPWAGTCLGF